MKKRTIKQVAADLERRVAHIESLIGKAKPVKNPSGKPKSLPEHILALRDSGFFADARTADEVHTKLKGRYTCDVNRVVVALNRLRSRRELRKTSKQVGEKQYLAYVR